MLKAFYALAWVFLVLISVRLALTGTLNPVALLVLSLAAVALVYGLALWSVLTDAKSPMRPVFDRNAWRRL